MESRKYIAWIRSDSVDYPFGIYKLFLEQDMKGIYL
jgi:hypothetical protein